jgi:hypothetical protein
MDIKITADTATHWIINNIYKIYKNNGRILNIGNPFQNDIPQEVYDKRDQLIYNNK